MPEIISCKEAVERGLKRYFTGDPCKYGHVSERRVQKRRCIQCEREWSTSEKFREIRASSREKNREKNREKIREWKRKHREKNLKKIRDWNRKYQAKYRKDNVEKMRQYYQNNLEEIRQKGRDYYHLNKDKLLARANGRYQKICDLIEVLRKEMPELLKEFEL